MILISEKQKEMLLSEECVLMGDGTFCYVPEYFLQLFVVHQFFVCTSFPVLFVYTEKRNEKCYEAIFIFLREMGVKIKMMMMDYEKASRSAFKKVFPDSELKGCFSTSHRVLSKRLEG